MKGLIESKSMKNSTLTKFSEEEHLTLCPFSSPELGESISRPCLLSYIKTLKASFQGN